MKISLGNPVRKIKIFTLYLLVFCAVGSIALTPLWHDLDWRVMQWLRHEPPPTFSPDILLVDVSYDDNPEVYRERVGSLLGVLSGLTDMPRAVALDMYFAKDDRGMEAVKTGIASLRARKVPVYGAVSPLDESGNLSTKFMERHAAPIYTSDLDGFWHTRFDVHLLTSTAKYEPYLDLGQGIGIPALAVRLAEDLFGRPALIKGETQFLSLGTSDSVADKKYRFVPALSGGGEFAPFVSGSQADFKGKLVIVGSREKDISPLEGRSGPEVLAWAVSDRILTTDTSSRLKVLTSPSLLLGMVALFCALAAGVYYLLFRFVTRLQDRLWVVATITVAVCLGALAVVVGILRLLDSVYPAVTLVVLGVAVTALLSWHYSHQALMQKTLQTLTSSYPDKYDVFISYSNTPENLEWVRRNVYEPLTQVRKLDGSFLLPYFDKAGSIVAGDDWFSSLANGINESRFFVPIYTEDYFKSEFCLKEMEWANYKRLNMRPPSKFILPVARKIHDIPSEYRLIQAIDVTVYPDFIEKIAHIILEDMHKRKSNALGNSQ